MNGALDYEETSSYNLKIIATDSKGSTKEINNNFNVVDVTYLQNTLHVNQKIRSEPTSFLGQVGIAQYLMIDENLGLESDDEKEKLPLSAHQFLGLLILYQVQVQILLK